MRTSVHRCLVFLGDLARYASQAAPKAAVAAAGSTAAANTAAKSEWTKAIGFYRMAAHVLPRSGNPHNQLAVMAFMTGEELKAAYHYARSLCVLVPFMTARENLLQLLQTNRDRWASATRLGYRMCLWHAFLCVSEAFWTTMQVCTQVPSANHAQPLLICLLVVHASLYVVCYVCVPMHA